MTCFFRSFELIRNVLLLLSLIAVSKRIFRLLLVLFAALVPLQTLKAGMVSVPPDVGAWEYLAGRAELGQCYTLTKRHYNQPLETIGIYDYQSCRSGGSYLSGDSCAIDETIEIRHLSGPVAHDPSSN